MTKRVIFCSLITFEGFFGFIIDLNLFKFQRSVKWCGIGTSKPTYPYILDYHISGMEIYGLGVIYVDMY